MTRPRFLVHARGKPRPATRTRQRGYWPLCGGSPTNEYVTTTIEPMVTCQHCIRKAAKTAT